MFDCPFENLWTWYFVNERIDFAAHWNKWSTGRGCEKVDFGGLEVKSQGHVRAKTGHKNPTYLCEAVQTRAPPRVLSSSDARRSSHTHRTGPSRFFCCCSIHLELSTCWHSTVRKHSHFQMPLENPSIQTHIVLLCCIKRLCIFGPKGTIQIRYYYYFCKLSQKSRSREGQNRSQKSIPARYLKNRWRSLTKPGRHILRQMSLVSHQLGFRKSEV